MARITSLFLQNLAMDKIFFNHIMTQGAGGRMLVELTSGNSNPL